MDKREHIISLTGENSHKVSVPRGQGTFSIGTKGISEGVCRFIRTVRKKSSQSSCRLHI